jgi:hypothetical protein
MTTERRRTDADYEAAAASHAVDPVRAGEVRSVELGPALGGHTYRVEWSADDGELVGLCDQYPSLSWLAADRAEALRGIREIVAGVVADMPADTVHRRAP